MKWFCPFCWTLLDKKRQQCPACRRDLSQYDRLSYEDKLIGALHHPVREHRMIAAETLGRLRSRRALPALAQLLKEEADPYLVMEVVRALARIDTPDARLLLAGATSHPSRLVRKLAEALATEESGRA